MKATQKQFDQARGTYPGLPSARALCQRFELSWRQLLRAATSDPRQQTRQASYGRRNTSRKNITLDDCIDAIRRVARKNNLATLTRRQYGSLRDQMSKRSSSLPTINQVDAVLAKSRVSWPEALKRAGLTAQAPNFSVRKLPHWTPESVTAGLRKAQGLLEPGQSLTQRRLQQIAVQHEDIPGWSPVHRECQRQGIGFADLKAQAGIS